MKKWLYPVIFLIIFTFSACAGEDPHSNSSMPEFVDVEILMPDEIEVGETVQIQCRVTQGDETVNDADEVEFELWKDGDPDDQHQEIEGTLEGDGIYYIDYTFDEPGTYYVISHVTAREYHIMPQKEFKVVE
ncbi:YtkA-like protein [Melghiribacillus thermohalophilus]|uniref:YtkA-like protein n=1 Tax=Melghiribacillus thermohalophilus TaxID=1324956 RepID=A0A4R3MUV1_9BACI|nr:FixH family protein [Melghiribacillus thermohalophilus]TCT18078.1 YtkA-like protein [Melghiribacillus thermohalophilus]